MRPASARPPAVRLCDLAMPLRRSVCSVYLAECASSGSDLASGVIMLLLASEALLHNPDLASRHREGTADDEAWGMPSHRHPVSERNVLIQDGRAAGQPSTAAQASSACLEPPSIQTRREKENADGRTTAKRLRQEFSGACDHCRAAVEGQEPCSHCRQRKMCAQCGTLHTPQWRTGPKGSMGLRTAFGGQRVESQAQRARKLTQRPVVQGAAVTQRLKPGKPPGTQRLAPKQAPGAGTQVKKKLSSIGLFGAGKEGLRARKEAAASPRLLARLEQLRLLSKAEQAGLLSLAERNGLTLTFIEKSGLLSKAESLGLLSAATDRNTPGALFALAVLLGLAAPAIVYLTPDSSSGLVAAQALLAGAAGAGAVGLFFGSSLIAALQKAD
ncbi:hypothetical protein WJX81_003752 [Elliptochloris bilobata]|uniref:GATA-type domain-containing protein n=1 Tax=Elliptochloris bilobata TaxID=381761 RepID=A0AAW1RMX7_9CHLO